MKDYGSLEKHLGKFGMNNAILVSGATGFLGSLICHQLFTNGYNIIAVVRNNSSLDRLAHIKSNIQFVYVNDLESLTSYPIQSFIHVATNYGRNSDSSDDIFQSNLEFPKTILSTISQISDFRKIINIDTLLPNNINDYADSKSQFTQYLKSTFSDRLSILNLRSDMFFGSNQNQGQFIHYLIQSFLSNTPVIPLTPGDQYRYVTYVNDLLKIIQKLMNDPRLNQPGYFSFDVIPDAPVKVRDLILLIKQLTSNTITKCDFGAVPYRDNEPFEPIGDNNILKEYIGEFTFTTLSKALSDVIYSYGEQNENILQR